MDTQGFLAATMCGVEEHEASQTYWGQISRGKGTLWRSNNGWKWRQQKDGGSKDRRGSALRVSLSRVQESTVSRESAESFPGVEMNRFPPHRRRGEGSVSGFCVGACYCCFRQQERFGDMAVGQEGEEDGGELTGRSWGGPGLRSWQINWAVRKVRLDCLLTQLNFTKTLKVILGWTFTFRLP